MQKQKRIKIIQNSVMKRYCKSPKAEEYMTEYADAYITSDDTMTYVVDTEKIHFKDENGK